MYSTILNNLNLYFKLNLVKRAMKKTSVLERLKSQKGQGLVEYALILLLVVIVVVAVLTTLGDKILNLFNQVRDEVPF